MAIQTPETYYLDDDLHGGYQYSSLDDVITEMELEAQDDDSFLKGVARHKIVRVARNGLKEMNQYVARDVLAIEITVPPTLYWTLPQDYVNYARISVVFIDPVTGARRLEALDVNNNINTATGYLQDNEYQIMFDDLGQILTADSANGYAWPYKTYGFCKTGGQSFLNTQDLSKYGEFKIDQRRGKVLFSSQMLDQELVIEYLSDGLQADLSEGEITVHKDVVQALKHYTYYNCIAMSRNVPQIEKRRAKNEYLQSFHQACYDRADISIIEINRVMRAKTSWP